MPFEFRYSAPVDPEQVPVFVNLPFASLLKVQSPNMHGRDPLDEHVLC